MIKEDKLIKLLKEAAQSRKHDLEDGYLDFESERFEKLSNYIIKGLRTPIGKKQSEKVVVKYFNDILPFIGRYNMDIIRFYGKSFIHDPDIKDKMAEGIKNYPYPDQLDDLFRSFEMSLSFNNEEFNNLLNDECLSYLATIDDPSLQYYLTDRLDEEKQKKFLTMLANNKMNIRYLGIRYKGNNKQIIFDNIELFTNNSADLYLLREFVKDDPKTLEYVKNYMDSHEEQTLDSIFCSTETHAKITDPTLRDVIKLIIKDITKNENCKLSDITYNAGGLSRVLVVGDKVIKIGKRATINFPNNPYIIAPLLRKELENNGEKLFIEVTEKVDNKTKVTKEEEYQLYKNLRDLGLIWTDIKPQNVGRLTKENIIHWNKNLAPSDEVLNFDGNVGNKTLKEGDLVILDADLIFHEDDPNILYVNQKEISEEFAKRYEEEKNNDIINTVKK